MSSYGFGPSKKGRIADSSMMTRNVKLSTQGASDATYSGDPTKNPFRLSAAILNGAAYASAIVAQQNMGVLPPPAAVEGRSEPTGTLRFTGTYIQVANKPGLQLGSGDLTIEWWMNMDPRYPPEYPRVFTFSQPVTRTQIYGVSIEGIGTNRTFYLWNSRTDGAFMLDNRLPWRSLPFEAAWFNTWHHFAIVGSGGGKTITVYVDGVSKFSQTFTNQYIMSDSTNTSALNIGSYPESTTAQSQVAFIGSITNFRIVKGTAVYTANFNRPTSPLTAISGTTLLLVSTNETDAFKDSSTDNSTVTFVGTPRPVWSSQRVF